MSELIANVTANFYHTDHPLRHWDRTCPACQQEGTAPAPLPEERTVSVRELVKLLESDAANTDTDWRWEAATALRRCPHWETLKLILRSDV
jgi:hypothetical protein